MANGMKSSPNVHFMYDYVFPLMRIVIACTIVNNASFTIFKRVGSIIIMLAKL